MSRFGIATPGENVSPLKAAEEPTAATPRRRRWWRWPLLGLVILMALAGGYEIAQLRKPPPPRTISVLAVTTNIPPGTPIAPSDLTSVTLPAPKKGHSVPWLPASEAAAFGNTPVYATEQLAPGTLLTSADRTTTTPPGAGQRIIGVDLKGNQAPVGSLPAGTQVTVLVNLASSQPPYPGPRTLTNATVWYAASDGNGGENIDLVVPSGAASAVANYASHDEIGLVRFGQ